MIFTYCMYLNLKEFFVFIGKCKKTKTIEHNMENYRYTPHRF